MSHNPLLVLDKIVKEFGQFRALDGVSITLEPGEILGLVGPNGSGKTTCINVIAGLYKPDGGSFYLNGNKISKHSLTRMAHMGVNRTFQVPKPFKSLTVRENLIIADQYSKRTHPPLDELLEFVGLKEYENREAGSLNSSQQKLLDLARALACGPQLLLIDELAAGLNPSELEKVAEKVKYLAQSGIAILLVEHLLGFINSLTKRVIVMNAGKEIFEGDLESAARNPEVNAVYLGG